MPITLFDWSECETMAANGIGVLAVDPPESLVEGVLRDSRSYFISLEEMRRISPVKTSSPEPSAPSRQA